MLGDNIREERKRMKLSQTELGSKLGVNKQTVSNWENGYRIPPTETLHQLANVFNVSIDSLLDRDNNKTRETLTIIEHKENLMNESKDLEKHIEVAKEISRLNATDQILVKELIKSLNNKKDK